MYKSDIQNAILKLSGSTDKKHFLLKLLHIAEICIPPQTLPFQPLFSEFDCIMDISALALCEYFQSQINNANPDQDDYADLICNLKAVLEEDWQIERCIKCNELILPKERTFQYFQLNKPQYLHYNCFLNHREREKLAQIAFVHQFEYFKKNYSLLISGSKVSIYAYDMSLNETQKIGFFLLFKESLSKITIGNIAEYIIFKNELMDLDTDYAYPEELKIVKKGISETDAFFINNNVV
jgi:hypothetical protein